MSVFKTLQVFLFLMFCGLSVAQLPLQVKPKVRGYPKKHDASIEGRGVIEPMYRLNNTFIPSHYDIELRVTLDDEGDVSEHYTARGKTKIIGVTGEKIRRLVIHTNGLEINDSMVSVLHDGQRLNISGLKEDPIRNFLIIELTSEIDAEQQLEITLAHATKFSQIEEGLFYRTYKTDNGETRVVAATQFESVYARKLFPCFDEPALKATFEFTIIHKKKYIALSNTERVSSTADPAHPTWAIDKFARTVRMSTYTLAFSITDFVYSEAFFGSKPARTYAPKHLIDIGAGEYSAGVAAKCLSFYENYFNESYKLSKMDSIAIDEFSGAMENWGMNIYGTDYLLILPQEQSEADRNQVNMIIAHELAHQWFGNLVTMKWWNHLYLAEGLTTYAQYLGIDASNPEFFGVEWAILDAFQYSMKFDAGLNSHPLSLNVSTPDEIEAMFSTITYEKGASILRMLEGILTRPIFQKGLQQYLKQFQFDIVEQDDLFEVLQDVAEEEGQDFPGNLTLPIIMHTWTDQSGFPLVKVATVNESHVNISQERFKNDGSSQLEGMWYVPIALVRDGKPLENLIPEVWLENDGKEQVIPHNTSEWVMINPNATGFYRVMYDDNLLKLIQKQLEKNASVISPLSRSQLLDDYFTFYLQKHINIQAALNLTKYLHQETHFTVWSAFFDHFTRIYKRFGTHTGYPLIQKYLQPKLDAALLSVGVEFDKERHKGANAILRADLLDWSCANGSPLCKEYAMKLLAQWVANPGVNPIVSVDARPTLLCAIVGAGGQQGFDFIFGKYQDINDSEIVDEDLRDEYLNALACAMEPSILQSLLNKTLDVKSALNPSDRPLVLRKVSLNPVGRKMMIPFLTKNLDQVIQVVGSGSVNPVGVVLNEMAPYLSTQSHIDEIQAFVDANRDKLSSISGTIRSVLAALRRNKEWMDTTGLDAWMWFWSQTK